MNMECKIQNRKPTLFAVQNNGEWADFIIETGTDNSDHNNNWVTVVGDSSFGSFSHHWCNIGNSHWADFLYNPKNMDYIMKKFLGSRRMEWDPDLTIQGMKQEVMANSTHEWCTPEEVSAALSELSTFDTDVCLEMFINQLCDSDWFGIDSHEYIQYSVKPWVNQFWDELWVPFTRIIKYDQEYRNII